MPYLLDGNNLIGRVRRTAKPGDEDRRALLAELAGRLRSTRARAIVFFDGPAGDRGTSLGSLVVRASTGGSADDAIVAEVRAARAPGEAIVVTSDRELSRRVRDAGGRVCLPDEFFRRFGAGGAGEAALAEDRRGAGARIDVEEWTKWFEDPGNRGGGDR